MSTSRSPRTPVDPPRFAVRDVRSILRPEIGPRPARPFGPSVRPVRSDRRHPRRCAISELHATHPAETDFSAELRLRVAEAQASLVEGRENGDDYLVRLSLGQIESFARLAQDNQIDLDGVEETLAPYRSA
jgi:hypothetical protein